MVLLTCSLFPQTLSLSLGLWRAWLVRWPAELSALHLGAVRRLHHDGGKPLGQLWIPFMGIWEDLVEAYVRLTEGRMSYLGRMNESLIVPHVEQNNNAVKMGLGKVQTVCIR